MLYAKAKRAMIPHGFLTKLDVSAAGAVSADEVAAVPADDLIHRIGAGVVAECADGWESVAVFYDGCFDVHGVVGW